MLKTYITQLKEKSGLSYLELSKQLNMNYSTLNNMRSGLVENISLDNLVKLENFEKRNKLLILNEILFDDNNINWTHLLLCHLYLNNYNVDTSYLINKPYIDKPAPFEGYAFKKRIGSNHIVIDSWNQLVKEHAKLFKYIPSDSFINQEAYLFNVLQFAIGKFSNCTDDNIRRYYILVEDTNAFNIIKDYKVKGATTHIVILPVTKIEDIANIDIK